jgi:hypothetical protein
LSALISATRHAVGLSHFPQCVSPFNNISVRFGCFETQLLPHHNFTAVNIVDALYVGHVHAVFEAIEDNVSPERTTWTASSNEEGRS